MKGAVIMPNTDADFVKVKHWLISKDKCYKTLFVEVENGEHRPLMMCDMSLFDRLLFHLTFGRGSVVFK